MSDNLHATGLVLGDTGIMIRGPSGSGKSLLALELIERWQARGRQATLVADDQLLVSNDSGLPMMAAPSVIAGRIELRGRGIIGKPFTASARIDLVVDLVDRLERMPEPEEFTTELMGLRLARCPVARRGVIDGGHQALLVEAAISALAKADLPQGQKST